MNKCVASKGLPTPTRKCSKKGLATSGRELVTFTGQRDSLVLLLMGMKGPGDTPQRVSGLYDSH